MVLWVVTTVSGGTVAGNYIEMEPRPALSICLKVFSLDINRSRNRVLFAIRASRRFGQDELEKGRCAPQ
jgi:hypothetical protein